MRHGGLSPQCDALGEKNAKSKAVFGAKKFVSQRQTKEKIPTLKEKL